MLIYIARFFYPNLQHFRLGLENILLFSLKKFPEIKVKLFASYFNFKKASGAIVDKNTTLNIYYKSLTRWRWTVSWKGQIHTVIKQNSL